MIFVLVFLIFSSCSRNSITEILPEMKKANALFVNKKYEEALTVLEEIEEENPGFSPALYLSGKIHIFNNNPQEAEQKFKKLIDKKPYHVQAGKQLLSLYIFQRKFSEAEEIFLKLAESSSEDPELFILAGKMLKSQEKYLEAIEYYNKAFIFEDRIIDAHIDVAEIYWKYGISEKARTHLEKAAFIGGVGHELYEPVMSILKKVE